MKDSLHLLTEREKQVIHLLAKALTYKEISASIQVSPETVKKHARNIYKKLNARNKIEAIHKVNLL